MDIIKTGSNEIKSKEADELRVSHQSKFRARPNSWMNIATAVLLFGIAILLVAVACLPHSTNHSETKYINSKVFQAVSVSTGGSSGDQIYFGNIKTINASDLILDNVFYIVTPTATTTGISIEPLVCQVDAPFSQMIISRGSVNWWENLQNGGKVSQAITNYENSSKTTCPQLPSTTANPTASSTTGSNSSSSSSSTSPSSTP